MVCSSEQIWSNVMLSLTINKKEHRVGDLLQGSHGRHDWLKAEGVTRKQSVSEWLSKE